MQLREIRPTRLAYLELVTELLQRQRLADPYLGLWEAADVQWWYTRDPHDSAEDAAVWLAGDVPVVAAVFTQSSPGRYGCDVLGDSSFAPAWEFVLDRCSALRDATVEMALSPTDDAGIAEAARIGFTEIIENYNVMWLDPANRAPRRNLPPGYTLVARPDQVGEHPMIKRNGAPVEVRLRQCSVYDPELDLAVVGPAGDVAAYAMFWPDLRTGVGLIEPMRVEDEHSGRGLGGALLSAGLDRLVARGCTRLKISHDVTNEVAGRLYRGAGFTVHATEPVYRFDPASVR